MKPDVYAHSLAGCPTETWELLANHLAEVTDRAARFADVFGWAVAARAAGLLHDIGKISSEYQNYISAAPRAGQKGPDHSTAGAREAERVYGKGFGRLIAFAIAGHHAGLANYEPELRRRIVEKPLPDYRGWEKHAGELPAKTLLAPTTPFRPNAYRGFSEAFLTRMLFSCLVDADFLATERFYTGAERLGFSDLATLQTRLTTHLAKLRHDDTVLNRLRTHVREHAITKAGLMPGLFTLTVPTGGGKTLTSLAFALEHARLYGLQRVIYVIPFTSIIEQAAKVFREVLESTGDILEHHASFDWEPPNQSTEAADDEGQQGLSKLRKASENWDAPIIVTTAVQFFESLFARHGSRCRKLHNIANAVVILDEAQTLPLRLLRPCMAAMNELATNYRTSLVLCTATQPALRVCDGFVDRDLKPRERRKKVGFDIDESRELAPDPQNLAATLNARVEIIRRPGKTADSEILRQFVDRPQMLCIVNNRRHARDLYDALTAGGSTSEGARHLTTLMCPKHRRSVLAEVNARLKAKLPVRLVATSLIEAGVDIDFPEVWRATAGLDSVAQAAGRCNREGKLPRGLTVVFEPADGASPADLQPLIACMDSVFQKGAAPLSLDGIRGYFQEVYWLRGAEAMDAATLEQRPWPILQAIADSAGDNEFEFEFERIAQAFRLIDSVQETVIVPYDADAVAILARLARMERPLAEDLRKLQQYVVSIPRRDRDHWLVNGVLRPVHQRIGDSLLCFHDLSHYREHTGIDLREPERRDTAANLI